MKAIVMTEKGTPAVLALTEIAEPEVNQADQIKIKIKAAGVNPIDTKVRRNGSFYTQPLPLVLGCDGSGVITAKGKEVTTFNLGDEVWFCNGGLGEAQGNYAEYTVIKQRWVALKPKSSSFVEAAAMPLVLITAWNALFSKGNLQAQQIVLIHGGAGGVGHVAIQLAKQKGATVITTVSSEEKAALAKSFGADHCIIYTTNGFIEEVMHYTNGLGVDLVLDTVGAEVFKQSISASAYFGRIITLLDPGTQSYAEARMKNLLIGFELMLTPLLKSLDKERDKHMAILNQCAQWIDQGQLKVHVSDTFTMQQAAVAHSSIEQGSTVGKIVLTGFN